ncbi:MAG: hypothetical protein ACE5KI_03290 [Dehalococcoidia bacterium]
MKPTFVTFIGGWGDTPVEEMMASAHRAIARDTLEQARATEVFENLVVVTDSPGCEESWGRGVVVERSQTPFHLGRQLQDVIRKYRMESVFYVGGGGLPLLSSQQMAEIARQLTATRETVISNNPYSGDLIAVTPAQALDRVPPPDIDNSLPQLLAREAGLSTVTLPREVSTLFDVDTPTDLAILSLYPRVGPNLRTYLETLELSTDRLRRAARLFTDDQAEVVIAGRVSGYVWSRLEQETACRCRILSEERGMRADGREAGGKVRSILGVLMERVDPREFFRCLSELGDAVVMDTRVLFNHMNLHLSASDRFLSDMMRPEGIAHPWLREYTQAALEAPTPLVFGGHSLVSGGLLAMIDIAWAQADLVDKV